MTHSPSSAQSVEPLWSATPDGIACRKEFEISQGQPRFDVEFNPTTEHYHRDNGIGFICIATDTEWQLWQKAWRAAASAQATQAVEEGCTPADAKMLRAANHSLATENDMLRMRLRPFAQVAVGPLSWATVEYHVEGDSEKQIFRTPSMQRAFNRAADALRELTPPPNDDYEVDRGTHIERVPFYNADLSATPPSPDAHTIGEDAANVAMGEREAPLSLIPDLVKRDELAVNTALLEIGDAMSMWRAAVCKYREITSHDQSAFCDGYEAGMAEILKARTQTGQEPVAWALKGKSGVVREVTADREATSNWHPDFVVALSENSTLYAAPQQPAQLVAQTLALTDEQRKSIWWAVLEAEKDEPEPGTLMHRRAQDLRALLAAQPASGETE